MQNYLRFFFTDHNFVKNSLILILFTFLESKYKMLPTSFVLGKKCLDGCETDKRQSNTRHFCQNFLFCFAP
jgi:hypothetical protein